jgi:capsule polysaccharide export protein KpsC/LpsZ
MQFITPCERVGHIKSLEEFYDIEYSQDFSYIINSQKPALIWNYFAFRVPGLEKLRIRYAVWDYYKNNGLPAFCMERGGLPNTVYLDSDGFCTESRSYDLWKDHRTNSNVDGYMQTLRESSDSLETQLSPIGQQNILRLDLNLDKYEKVIFVPLQVRNDTTILTGSRLGIHDLLRLIYWLASKHPTWMFLVKSHPLDNYQYPEGKNVKKVTSYHYKDCIDISHAVVCINSGVGLQALAWGKPVFNLGKAFYSQQVLTKTSIPEKIEKDLQSGFQCKHEEVRQFFSFLINDFYTYCDNCTHQFKAPIKLI